MVERFKDYFFNALTHDDMTKKLPDHVFYRDGVSESQFGMVKSEEIPQIEGAIEIVKAELQVSKKHPE
jgi:Piwi domain